MPTDGSIRRTGERSSSSTGKSERRSPAEPPGLRSRAKGTRQQRASRRRPTQYPTVRIGIRKHIARTADRSASERTESPVTPNETYHHDTDKTHLLDLLVRMGSQYRSPPRRPASAATLRERKRTGAVRPALRTLRIGRYDAGSRPVWDRILRFRGTKPVQRQSRLRRGRRYDPDRTG